MPRMGDLAATDVYSAFDVPGEQSTNVGWANRMGEILTTRPTYDEQTVLRSTASPLVNITEGDIGRATEAAMGVSGGGLTFGGKMAKTADLGALARAEQMTAKGHAPAEITSATGWFKAPDGQWKFEIADAPSKWVNDVHPYKPTEKMGNAFEHPELYAAYPQLRDIDLNTGMARGRGDRGSYQPSGEGSPPTITLGQSGAKSMRETNLHELQHAIQNIEGFATGGNTWGLRPKTPSWDIYQERLKAIKTPSTKESLEASGVLGPEYTYADYLKSHKEQLRNPDSARMLDRAAQDYAVYEGYRRLAGETEARAVSARANLDPTKLRDTPVKYDVPPEQQIVKMGSLAEPQLSIEKPSGIRAYHSSPHDFDKFDLAKIGTGEGAQVYGHGLYFAESPAVSGQGGQYWQQFADRFRGPEETAANILQKNKFDREAAAKDLSAMINREIDRGPSARWMEDRTKALQLLESGKPVGPRTYEVNINADPAHMLDWDKPLSAQPHATKTIMDILPAAERRRIERWEKPSWSEGDPKASYFDTVKGGTEYQGLAGILGKSDKASAALREAGIPGIKYLDEGSRNMRPVMKTTPAGDIISSHYPPPTSNYVIFDPNLIRIDKKYAMPGAIGAGTMGALAAQDRYQQ